MTAYGLGGPLSKITAERETGGQDRRLSLCYQSYNMKNQCKYLVVALGAALLALPALKAQDGPGEGRRERPGQMGERMIEELGLNADQQAKIKAINEAEKAEMKALSPEDRKATGREIRKKYMEQRQAVMTPEQRAKADKMRDGMEKRREKREDRKEKKAN